MAVLLMPLAAAYLNSFVSIYLNARVKKEALDQATLRANLDDSLNQVSH